MNNFSFYTNVEKYGSRMLVSGYDHKGKRVRKSVKYAPTIYTETDSSEFVGIDGVPIKPLHFPTMKEANYYLESSGHLNNYGNDKFIDAFIQEQFPGEIPFQPSLIDIGYFDIETSYNEGWAHASNPVNSIISIAYRSSKDEEFHAWGTKPYDPDKSELSNVKSIEYHYFVDEKSMLMDFMNFWETNPPDIITGWNVELFDVPYLIGRLEYIFGKDTVSKKMSPWNNIFEKKVFVRGKHEKAYVIYGIRVLDYMDLFKKFTKNTHGVQESYRLDHIANVVLGEKKLDYSDHGNLRVLYEQDHQKFIDYNIKDVELIQRLEDKLALISLVQTMSYLAGVNYNVTLGTTGIWDSIIYRKLVPKKIFPRIVDRNHKNSSFKFEGGYVKETDNGMHDWVVSFDLASLYPNIIVQYNMSPETLVGHMCLPEDKVNPDRIIEDEYVDVPNDNLAVAANGAVFRRDKKGIIPEIIESLYSLRVQVKKEMIKKKIDLQKTKKGTPERLSLERIISTLNTKQMAVKILMNSLFGAIGNKYFRYFDLRIARAITLTGQTVIRWAEKGLNEKLSSIMQEDEVVDRVIAIDTDSLYVRAKEIVDKWKPKNEALFLDKMSSDIIEPMFRRSFNRFAEITNAYENRMIMDREVIADRGIWVAKKRYILNVLNSEGVQYTEPELKIMGIEAIKSSTPMSCRNAMKKMFKIILNGTEKETQKAISDFKKHFNSLPAEEISFPRGISSVSKYKMESKGVPIHCRGSLIYNNLLKEKKLDNEYEVIRNGDKIKFCYLKQPNPIGHNVISFHDVLPPQFGLKDFVDYDKQFQKTFIDPIDIILEAIGWNHEEVATLEAFFS